MFLRQMGNKLQLQVNEWTQGPIRPPEQARMERPACLQPGRSEFKS